MEGWDGFNLDSVKMLQKRQKAHDAQTARLGSRGMRILYGLTGRRTLELGAGSFGAVPLDVRVWFDQSE